VIEGGVAALIDKLGLGVVDGSTKHGLTTMRPLLGLTFDMHS
jgi:hypothetical protein